jgi:hypothetical protein
MKSKQRRNKNTNDNELIKQDLNFTKEEMTGVITKDLEINLSEEDNYDFDKLKNILNKEQINKLFTAKEEITQDELVKLCESIVKSNK